MHLKTRNVNTAFRTLVSLFSNGYSRGEIAVDVVHKPSRNGEVLMIEEPVIVTFTHPRERVLFNAARDANPFFHLYEALWMLAGRNDVAPVAYYAKNMLNYSDDGTTLNGAYGYRWRKANDPEDYYSPVYIDQLKVLISHLRADPNSRRAVLQMWNVEDDLLKIGGGECKKCDNLRINKIAYKGAVAIECEHGYDVCPKCDKCKHCTGSKDVCCNLSVCFSIRDSDEVKGVLLPPRKYLDMTVFNRSNDLVWGMLGANVVHFSFLQEYIAAHLGVGVGVYNQVTNNLHVYLNNFKPEEWLADVSYPYPNSHSAPWRLMPLVSDHKTFDNEVSQFIECNYGSIVGDQVWKEPFLRDVARRACRAFFEHKSGNKERSLEWADKIAADDWRIACTEWIKRRIK